MSSLRSILAFNLVLTLACGGSGVDDPVVPPSPTAPGQPSPPRNDTPADSPIPQETTTSPGSTSSFAPQQTHAARWFQSCDRGTPLPPFSNGDVFNLKATGSSGPVAGIEISPRFGVLVGSRFDLSVLPRDPSFGYQVAGDLGSPSRARVVVTFGSSVVAAAVDRVALTVLAFPSHDGDVLAARVEVHFVDGNTLDTTLAAKVQSHDGGCGDATGVSTR